MRESREPQPHRQPLTVINQSAKVEQLREEAAKNPTPPKHVDTTIVSRFVDANKTPKQKAIEEGEINQQERDRIKN